MYYGGAESWNLRDTHMFETLEHVLEARGPKSRAVVWAHNSHIGDARHTEMGIMREELNIGQLCRERFGHDCGSIGFGTHAGTVAAASDWDGELEVKQVRPSHRDSYERLFHDAGLERFLLDPRTDEAVRRGLLPSRLERFIGVIYRPDTELMSHYAEASLPQQFDAFVWFDRTNAVTPLGPNHSHAGARRLSFWSLIVDRFQPLSPIKPILQLLRHPFVRLVLGLEPGNFLEASVWEVGVHGPRAAVLVPDLQHRRRHGWALFWSWAPFVPVARVLLALEGPACRVVFELPPLRAPS